MDGWRRKEARGSKGKKERTTPTSRLVTIDTCRLLVSSSSIFQTLTSLSVPPVARQPRT